MAARRTGSKSEEPASGNDQLTQVLGLLQDLTRTVEEQKTQLADQATEVAALRAGGGAAGGAAPRPNPENPEGAEGGNLGGQLAAGLTADQLVDLLAARLGAAPGPAGPPDTIPWGVGFGLPVPPRIIHKQEAGERVELNLLQKLEYQHLVPGYGTLNPGAAAELDYDYVVAKRLDDVYRHLEQVVAGYAELDVQRAADIIKSGRDVLMERVEGIMHRAYVAAERPAGETDATVKAQMEKKRVARMRPAFSNGYSLNQSQLEELTDMAYAKKVAQWKAGEAFKRAGLGKTGGKPGGGGGGGGAAADD
jgi:hypothetical protein